MESNLISIIPDKTAPVYHLSQNDNEKAIRLILTEALTGTEILSVHYQKMDGTVGTLAVASTSGVNVDIPIPSTMTNIAGYVYGKLRIDGIGAKSFFIEIERRP